MLRMSSVSGRRAVLAAFMLSASGCSQWEVQAGAPAAIVAERKPAEIRVQRVDSTRLVLVRPVVTGDTIRGRTGAIATADIVSLELPSLRGVLPVLAIIIVVPLIALAACAASDCLSFSVGH